jgi:hypothetical protein
MMITILGCISIFLVFTTIVYSFAFHFSIKSLSTPALQQPRTLQRHYRDDDVGVRVNIMDTAFLSSSEMPLSKERMNTF